MILPSMLVQLNDIAKLRTFKLKGQMTKKALLYLFRYPSTGPYLDRSQAKKCTLATILTKSCGLQQHWCSGAPPGVTNPRNVFKPRGPKQGASCASWMVCLSRFKPCAGWCNSSLILPLLLAVLAREISSHQPWE